MTTEDRGEDYISGLVASGQAQELLLAQRCANDGIGAVPS